MGTVTRRRFLRGSAVSALVVLGCRKPEYTCDDTTGLAETDVATRQRVGYVDRSPDPARACDACEQWQAGPRGACGTCQLVRGPIHPLGTCHLFSPRA
jgi:hypothetical protein